MLPGHIDGTLCVMSAPRRQQAPEIVWGNSEGDCIVEDVQNGLHLQAWFELVDGAPRITELRLRSAAAATTLRGVRGPDPQQNYGHELGRKTPPGGITGPLLRQLRLSRLHDVVQQDALTRWALSLRGVDGDSDIRTARHPGRRGRSDYFYAVWAARYVEMCKTTRHPHYELARDYPDEVKGERAVQDLIRTAKSRGLLVGGSPGRAGGQLSAKAKRFLETGDTP